MDNMVSEGWFYKNNFASPELHGINLGLFEEEMKGDLIVHLIHMEDTWMKELVIHILYRGEFLERVMVAKYPLEILPLDIGALARADGL